jgi:hypothetical protein
MCGKQDPDFPKIAMQPFAAQELITESITAFLASNLLTFIFFAAKYLSACQLQTY